MTLSDDELTLYAIREAQLILADHIQPGSHNCAKTINDLLSVLDSQRCRGSRHRHTGRLNDKAAPPVRVTRLDRSAGALTTGTCWLSGLKRQLQPTPSGMSANALGHPAV